MFVIRSVGFRFAVVGILGLGVSPIQLGAQFLPPPLEVGEGACFVVDHTEWSDGFVDTFGELPVPDTIRLTPRPAFPDYDPEISYLGVDPAQTYLADVIYSDSIVAGWGAGPYWWRSADDSINIGSPRFQGAHTFVLGPESLSGRFHFMTHSASPWMHLDFADLNIEAQLLGIECSPSPVR